MLSVSCATKFGSILHHLLGSISGVLFDSLLERFLGSPFWGVVIPRVAFCSSHLNLFHSILISGDFSGQVPCSQS